MTIRAGRYVARIADTICFHIASGKSLQQSLAAVGYLAPKIQTVWKWLELHPDFREKYERARQLQADTHADRMLELGEEAINKPSSAAAYRVAIDVLKWQAEVRNRGKYGAKAEDAGKNKVLDPAKLRAEIKRLEQELGVAENKVKPLKAVNK